MMQVGIVRVLVSHRFVTMPMRMGLADRPVVFVAVMQVMNMRMLMLQSLMHVFVFVPLCQM